MLIPFGILAVLSLLWGLFAGFGTKRMDYGPGRTVAIFTLCVEVLVSLIYSIVAASVANPAAPAVLNYAAVGLAVGLVPFGLSFLISRVR